MFVNGCVGVAIVGALWAAVALPVDLAQAQEVAERTIVVECTDATDLNTCEFVQGGDGVAIANLVDTVSEIDTCAQTDTDEAVCETTAGQSITCQIDDGSAQCDLPGAAGADYETIGEDGSGIRVAITGPAPEAVESVTDELATTPATRSVGAVVAEVCTGRQVTATMQRDCDVLVEGLLSEDPEQRAEAAAILEAITANGSSVPIDQSQTSLTAQTRNIRGRLRNHRQSLGARPLNPGFQADIRLDGVTLASRDDIRYRVALAQGEGNPNGEAEAIPGGLLAQRLGVFVNGTLTQGDKDATANERGFELSGVDLTLGVDYRLNPQAVFGVALGYSSSQTDLDNAGGSLDGQGFSTNLFGSYYPSQRSYLDGTLSFGGFDYEQDRHIRYTAQGTPVDQTAEADYFGYQFGAMLSGGYDWRWRGLTGGPLVHLQYIRTEIGAYTEQVSDANAPGAGWAVAIDSQDYESLTYGLGGQLVYAVSTGWGVVQPQLRGRWIVEAEDDVRVVTGHFLGDPAETAFRMPTDRPDTRYYDLGVGASTVLAGGFSAYGFYNTILGFEDLTQYTVNFGARWAF